MVAHAASSEPNERIQRRWQCSQLSSSAASAARADLRALSIGVHSKTSATKSGSSVRPGGSGASVVVRRLADWLAHKALVSADADFWFVASC